MTTPGPMMRVPQDWLPHVHSDGVYWFWAPGEWSTTSPLSQGSFFALSSPENDILLEAFVLGVGTKPNAAALVESIMKRSLSEDHPGLRVKREGLYHLEEVDGSDALDRMHALRLMDGYGFVTGMRPAASCHLLTVEHSERATQAQGTTIKVTTDCFFLHREDLVLQLNMKTPSSNYANRARTFAQIAATARLGRFA